MGTRIEIIDNHIYCAYCGKLLNMPEGMVLYYPSATDYTCDCEKAKEELELCKKIKELYNLPLAENIINIKVEKYKNQLLGIKTEIYSVLKAM